MALLSHSRFRPLSAASRWRGFVAALVLFAAGGDLRPAPPPANPVEAEIKAAALYNIIPFVDWPEHAFATPESPLVIGILGGSPVATLIPKLVEGETWHGRPLVIEHYASPRDVRACHLLFIAQSANPHSAQVAKIIRERKPLTVSEREDFAANGGGIQLSVIRNKLRLTVNLAGARQAEVTLSTKLLRLATVLGESAP